MSFKYNTIEEAAAALRAGKIIMCTDDPDRENEGDLICAARYATTENVNFMASFAKGLICTPMSAEIARRLNLPQMVSENTDNHCTAFTVSVDHVDTSTGISAAERGYTCRACADLNTRPEELRRPGHVFPLVARRGGVLTRSGHTEATVDLCRLAGLEECGLCCEIMRDDGTMMRTPELQQMAQRMARSGRYDAVICVGAVIRGATSHYELVVSETAKGIAQAGMNSGVPVLFGVIATENIEQAIERAGSKAGNKGYDCALSAIEMVNLIKQF